MARGDGGMVLPRVGRVQGRSLNGKCTRNERLALSVVGLKATW